MDQTEVVVRSVRSVGPSTVAVELDAPAGFDARPGQFVQVAVSVDGEDETRHYTVSSPDTDDRVEVTVSVDPDGTVGPYIESLQPGDTVGLRGPFGHAFYEGEDRVTVVAGGPGVGPAVGIAERVLRDGGRATVVYVDDDHAHVDRLARLAAAGADVYLASGGPEASVDAVLDGDGRLFVYGFADFVETVVDVVEAAERDADDAKIESFG